MESLAVAKRAVSYDEPTPAVGDITEQVSVLERLVGELEVAHDNIESDLHSVLTPNGPCAALGLAGDRKALSPLADRLIDINDRLRVLIANHATLRGRVEL